MRFKQFLQEAKYKQELSRDKLRDMLVKHCSDAMEFFHKPMWRGTKGSNEEAYIIQGDAGARESTNSSNHYTVILDEFLPKVGYPKRSASIICTNNEGLEYAESYGTVYAIFPYDNVPIGVCPGHDIWKTQVTLGNRTKTMTRWNDWFDKHNLSDESFSALVKDLEKLLNKAYGNDDALSYFRNVDDVKLELKIGYGPKSLGMNLTTSKDILGKFNDKDRECWIGGPCIAIRKDIWEEMTQESREDKE